jgi:hypothetical protein
MIDRPGHGEADPMFVPWLTVTRSGRDEGSLARTKSEQGPGGRHGKLRAGDGHESSTAGV